MKASGMPNNMPFILFELMRRKKKKKTTSLILRFNAHKRDKRYTNTQITIHLPAPSPLAGQQPTPPR
jgi:hypothetical protein